MAQIVLAFVLESWRFCFHPVSKMEDSMRSTLKGFLLGAIVALSLSAPGLAADYGSKDEAVALVKKTVAAIKGEGKEKVYAEVSAKDAKYIDRDLYPVVYDYEGNCLAHGSNAKMVGKSLIDVQDADGKYFVKERVEKAKAAAPFWQDYKFANPVTKKIEPKEAYCEPLEKEIVCAGAYKK